jgi:HEAT repeat protein
MHHDADQLHNLEPTIREILTRLRGHTPSAEAARDQLEALDPISAAVVLQGLLTDNAYDSFDLILTALAELHPPTFFASAARFLTHPQSDVRWYICEMLSAYRDEMILQPLLHCAQHDPDADVRCSAVLALAMWPDPRVVPILEHIRRTDTGISPSGHHVAHLAAQALAECAHPSGSGGARVAPNSAFQPTASGARIAGILEDMDAPGGG